MIKENGYLKYFFKLEYIVLLIFLSVFNYFNSHGDMMVFIFFIFNSSIITEYIKLSNMMKYTRGKMFKDIIVGSLIMATVYCLCILIISKLFNLEGIFGNYGVLGIIQIVGIYLLSGLLGIKVGIFTSNNLNAGKKFIFKLSVLCGILSVLIVLGMEFTNYFQVLNIIIFGNYKIIADILLIIFIGVIGTGIVFNIRKNILKLEWK